MDNEQLIYLAEEAHKRGDLAECSRLMDETEARPVPGHAATAEAELWRDEQMTISINRPGGF